MATVLICEDDPFLAAHLAHSVEAAGHKVEGIAASARDIIEKGPPEADVAIVDLCLADGETGAMLAQFLQRSGVRVIVVSGHTNVTGGLCSIPHTYAPKPLPDEILRTLLGAAAEAAGGA